MVPFNGRERHTFELREITGKPLTTSNIMAQTEMASAEGDRLKSHVTRIQLMGR